MLSTGVINNLCFICMDQNKIRQYTYLIINSLYRASSWRNTNILDGHTKVLYCQWLNLLPHKNMVFISFSSRELVDFDNIGLVSEASKAMGRSEGAYAIYCSQLCGW